MSSYSYHVRADIQSWILPAQSLTLQTDSVNASIKTHKSLQFKGHSVFTEDCLMQESSRTYLPVLFKVHETRWLFD